jgi:ribose transport system substrate-binding protein
MSQKSCRRWPLPSEGSEVAGLKGDGNPQNISAGDGSESAYQRIRDKDYQAATVPEPLNMQGWQPCNEGPMES